MRRILIVIATVAVLTGMLAGPVMAARPAVRVAVIVGPVGGLTDYYRSIGTAAAREARRWTDDVVTVFSPDATWPSVRAALRGASIVVYLGHGNGWPSPYRDALYPATQNGLGLNPVAGGDDSAHQYFGESFLARSIQLAPGAVVLLHHLCYASGNSEPGVPEGTLAVARQRVDNYAAGWVRAGASAVVADTFGDPADYIRTIMGTNGAIDRIWGAAPTAHGHTLGFASDRSPGFEALMDPTRADSGFYRSLVYRPGLGAPRIRDGASGRGVTRSPRTEPGVPSLAVQGVSFQAPGLAPATSAPQGFVMGTRATLSLPVRSPRGIRLPADLQLGVRWDPITVDTSGSGAVAGSTSGPSPSPSSAFSPAPASSPGASSTANPGPGTAASPDPSAATSPDPSPSTVPSRSPDPVSSPTPSPQPTPTDVPAAGAAPPIEAVAPEVVSSVVTSIPARARAGRLTVTVDLPTVAGTYRLVTTVHAGDGVAYDAATQALVPALAVRVSRPLSARYGAVATLQVTAAGTVRLPVRIANDGSEPWAQQPILHEDLVDPSVAAVYPAARLVARWLPLGIGTAGGPQTGVVVVPARVDPGSQTTVELALVAPTVPGDYLLLLDIDSPLHGSLAAVGVPPGTVRVTVGPAPTPAP